MLWTWLEGQMRTTKPRREWESPNQERVKKNTFSEIHSSEILAFKVLLSEKLSRYKLYKDNSIITKRKIQIRRSSRYCEMYQSKVAFSD